MIVPAVRTLLADGETLALRVIVLAAAAPSEAALLAAAGRG